MRPRAMTVETVDDTTKPIPFWMEMPVGNAIRFWALLLMGLALVHVVMFAVVLGGSIETAFISWVGLSIGMTLFVYLGLYKRSTGAVYLSRDGIDVVTGWGRQSYPWQDVDSVTLDASLSRNWLNKLLSNFTLVDMNRGSVRIRCKRMIREDLVGLDRGTRLSGLPLGKSISLGVMTPESFIEAANKLQQRYASASSV